MSEREELSEDGCHIRVKYGHHEDNSGDMPVKLFVVADGVPLTVFARDDLRCKQLEKHIGLAAKHFKARHTGKMSQAF